jgi:hypothetical protein
LDIADDCRHWRECTARLPGGATRLARL